MSYQSLFQTDLSSVAALTFLVWDVFITLDQEAEAVWSKPNNFYIKWVFLFIRYFAVALQISLLFVGSQLSLNFHYTEKDCVRWYVFQEVSTQLLVAAVEFILMIRVHALYDRNRYVTATLLVLYLVENLVMVVTLIKVVPAVRFDAICTVIHSPSSLVIFAIAFVSFETVLFVLTLIKFLVALRHGWGRTPVIYLLMRDGTWAFILIFVTLCVNAGFYLGAANSAISAIAFPWLISVESFAGARIVLNLHTLSLNASTDALGSSAGGTLSSHLVFTTHPSAANHARTPSVRWDWGGLQEHSYDGQTGSATGDRVTGTVNESYEMTSTASGSGRGVRKHGSNTNGSTTDYTSPYSHSDTCIEIEEDM